MGFPNDLHKSQRLPRAGTDAPLRGGLGRGDERHTSSSLSKDVHNNLPVAIVEGMENDAVGTHFFLSFWHKSSKKLRYKAHKR